MKRLLIFPILAVLVPGLVLASVGFDQSPAPSDYVLSRSGWVAPITVSGTVGVTDFGVGSLPSFMTGSVINSTTTPVLNLSFGSEAPFSILGNAATSSASPAFTLLSTFLAHFNNTLYAVDYSGADAGAQIQACATAATSGGLVCDATGLTGSLSSAASISIPSNVTVKLGDITLTMASGTQITVGSNASLHGNGTSGTSISGPSAGNGLVVADGNATVSSLSIDNTDTTNTSSTALITSGDGQHLSHLSLSSSGDDGFYINNSYYLIAHDITATGAAAGLYAVGANSDSLYDYHDGSSDPSCMDIESTEGISFYRVDCENQTSVAVETGLSSTFGWPTQVEFYGGYIQPATGAYLFNIGPYTGQDVGYGVSVHGVFFFGYNNGCEGDCGLLTSYDSHFSPTNNGAVAISHVASAPSGGPSNVAGLNVAGSSVWMHLYDPNTADALDDGWYYGLWGGGNFDGSSEGFNIGTLTGGGYETVPVEIARSGLLYTRDSEHVGSLQTVRYSAPPAPSVATVGTAGSTSYAYECTGVDALGAETTAGTQTAITTGNTTLDSTNYNTIQCGGNFVKAKIYRTSSGGNPSSTGYIGEVTRDGVFPKFEDTGLTASGSPPVSNTTGGASIAGALSEGCAGTIALSSGTATVNNSCITGGRPLICTDNTATSSVGCTAVRSNGSVALYGLGSDTVSWAQL